LIDEGSRVRACTIERHGMAFVKIRFVVIIVNPFVTA
jgi:hypothetical protein